MFRVSQVFRPVSRVSAWATQTRTLSSAGNSVSLEDHGDGLAVISLCNAAKRNSLSEEFMSELNTHLDTLIADTPRAVVVRSTVEKVFCAGADLKQRLQMSDKEVADLVRYLRSSFFKFQKVKCPTIAAVDGVALGGGLELALECDIRVANPKTKLGLVETKLAIIPGAGGTQTLTRVVGPAAAKYLIMTGKIMTAEEALNYGVVSEVSPSADVSAFDQAVKLVHDDLFPKGPIALQAAKMAINEGMHLPLEQALDVEQAGYEMVIPTEDRIEALKAFVDKRPPEFKGK